MFINKITLYQFGRLNGEIRLDPTKCNIICQDNEFGKTTLMDAVLYAFYNFPTQGFKRTELKPKDRYKPWGVEDNTGFTVEIELQDNQQQNFRLKADFNRQQPFSLVNADTNQPIPLEGMSFGARKFRMPIQSFIQCFFFRQDEREGDRGELIRIIEEAAAANPRETPSSVSHAIELLSNPKIGVAEFSGDSQIQTATLLNRVNDRMRQLSDSLASLESACQNHANSIASAGELDSQIAAMESEHVELEYGLFQKEMEELENQLLRQNEINEAATQRDSRLKELREYEKFNPEVRPAVQEHYTEWRVLKDKFRQQSDKLDSELSPEFDSIKQSVNKFPESMNELAILDLEKLQSLNSLLADKKSRLEREQANVSALEQQLEKDNVPLDRLNALNDLKRSIADADFKTLTENSLARAEAEAVAAEAETAAAEAKAVSLQAKARKAWLNNIAFGSTGLVIAFLVIGIVLLFTGKNYPGYILVALSFLTGVGAFVYIAKAKSKIDTEELKPAVEQELSLSGQARKLREEAAELDEEYNAVLKKVNLSDSDVADLRSAGTWLQHAAPWQSAVANRDELEKEFDNLLNEAGTIILKTRDQGDTELDDDSIEVAIGTMKEYFEAKTKLVDLEKNKLYSSEELLKLKNLLSEKEQALAGLISVESSENDLDYNLLVTEYFEGCDKATKLRALLDESHNRDAITPEKVLDYKSRVDTLGAKIEAIESANPSIVERIPDESVSRLDLQDRLFELDRKRESLKLQRANLFQDSDRAVERWRTEGPGIREEIERLDLLKTDVQDFEEAVSFAHAELSEIADEVYAQWATAINERANEILPLLNNKYKDVSLTRSMDISLYSEEAGRRLENREIQHLSKGARDQVGLAIRLAVSEFLSSHVGHLPLVLDEPFAHWDDLRFVEGMRFLEKITSRHQLIMLSCHKWRYDQLKSADPELYEKIHFCTLEPIS